MAINISKNQLALVREIVERRVPNYTVWCFGSIARGDNRAFSDLDLVIMSKGVLDFSQLAKIRSDFDESNLPFKVDVSDWFALDPEFKKIVEADHVVVQGE